MRNMAAASRLSYNVAYFYYIQTLFSVVLCFQIIDQSNFNPSRSNVNFQNIDGNYWNNGELIKTAYHVYKRSAIPPIKKATSLSEKKMVVKSVTTESVFPLKPFLPDVGNVTENITLPINSTVLDVSTVDTKSPNDKYNVNISATVVPDTSSNMTITDAPIEPSTTTSKLPSVTTSLPEMLPTKPSNITNTTVDHHVYYNSTMFLEDENAMAFKVNFDELPQDKVVVHRMLSDSHRRAATVTLSFDFPFYGHPLRNITIATGGFVYMGDYMHSWLAATQYIAPLMANFDTSLSNESTVRYFDNGTAFVIEWHEVTLQDEKRGGNFTFQTTLLKNGNIIFVYEIIPVSVKEIGDEVHPVKVGLSDAYVIDRVIYFIRRKTIYEYHRIDMKKEEIGNHTAIYFTALTTCLSFRDCKSCMNADVGLDCVWCESAKRCSDGLDRLRQDWLQSKCDVEKHSVNCSAYPPSDSHPFVQPLTDAPSKTYTIFPRPSEPDHYFETTTPYMPVKPGQANSDDGASSSARVSEESSSVGVGSVIAILLILAVVMGGMVWIGYAYRNPHTSSGQLLIRYRPSQWRFRSGEARYTAASVHM